VTTIVQQLMVLDVKLVNLKIHVVSQIIVHLVIRDIIPVIRVAELTIAQRVLAGLIALDANLPLRVLIIINVLLAVMDISSVEPGVYRILAPQVLLVLLVQLANQIKLYIELIIIVLLVTKDIRSVELAAELFDVMLDNKIVKSVQFKTQ
jgi:hypothetical protein